jgi:lipopolysaccharide export LptBFGC system permease protein LptF
VEPTGTESTRKKNVMTLRTATQRRIAFALSLGLLGGGALIATVSHTTRGPVILLTYAMIVLSSAFYVRLERLQGFANRFALSLGVFMFATLLLYVFIGLFQAKTFFVISIPGHLWRLGLMLIVGAALSAAVAQLTSTSKREEGRSR